MFSLLLIEKGLLLNSWNSYLFFSPTSIETIFLCDVDGVSILFCFLKKKQVCFLPLSLLPVPVPVPVTIPEQLSRKHNISFPKKKNKTSANLNSFFFKSLRGSREFSTLFFSFSFPPSPPPLSLFHSHHGNHSSLSKKSFYWWVSSHSHSCRLFISLLFFSNPPTIESPKNSLFFFFFFFFHSKKVFSRRGKRGRVGEFDNKKES